MTTPHDDEITCPDCKGRGFGAALVFGGPEQHVHVHPTCKFCNGDGHVHRADVDERNQEIDDGEAFDLAEDR